MIIIFIHELYDEVLHYTSLYLFPDSIFIYKYAFIKFQKK
mgnify:CR=1 FL=1